MLPVLLICMAASAQSAWLTTVAVSGEDTSALVAAFANATVVLTVESADAVRTERQMADIIDQHPDWIVLSAPAAKFMYPKDLTDITLITVICLSISAALFLLGMTICCCAWLSDSEERKQLNYKI
jgi:hypothetical protein